MPPWVPLSFYFAAGAAGFGFAVVGAAGLAPAGAAGLAAPVAGAAGLAVPAAAGLAVAAAGLLAHAAPLFVIELPETRTEYLVAPAVKVNSLPRSLPFAIGVAPRLPVTFWNVCVSFSAPAGVFQVPFTLAGTIHRSAVHQLVQSFSIACVSSASQSSIVKELETMRVPGRRLRSFGRSVMLMLGSRNIVMTV